jgi:hypothetical protein
LSVCGREKNIIKDAFFQATQNRQRMYIYTHRR